MKEEIKAPRRTTREQQVGCVVVPAGAILADLSAQAPNNSYCPPLYYKDHHFRCADCGVEQVWTAEQQWQYFEVWKKNINHQVVRCGHCQGDRKRANQATTARTIEARRKSQEAQGGAPLVGIGVSSCSLDAR